MHRLIARHKTPRLSLFRPTAQLKTLPPSCPGPSCHAAAPVPRSAPRPLMTLTLVLSLAPHLSMLAGGRRFPFCVPHALRVLLAFRPLQVWKCSSTTRCRSTSFPLEPSRHARHKRRMPVPPQRENIMPLHPATGGKTCFHPQRRPHRFRTLSKGCLRYRVLRSPSPAGRAPSSTLSVTSRITSGASVLQCNPGPARKNPTQIRPAACGRFHAVIPQEAKDHAPPVSDQFIAHIDGNDLAILLNEHASEPGASVFPISEASPSKDTWRMAALVVSGLLRRPCLADSPQLRFAQSTFTKKMPRNVSQRPVSCNVFVLTWCCAKLTSSVATSTRAPCPRWVTFSLTRISWLLAMLSCGALVPG